MTKLKSDKEGAAGVAMPAETWRAVFNLGMGPHVGSLLWHVLELSYGATWGEEPAGREPAEPVEVNLSELARQRGVPHQRIYEARDWLLASRLIDATGERNKFRFNHDYEQWVHPGTGEPLLSPRMLAYCKAALA